jgi:hypothetical protein
MLDAAWSLISEAVQDRREHFHLPAVAPSQTTVIQAFEQKSCGELKRKIDVFGSTQIKALQNTLNY